MIRVLVWLVFFLLIAVSFSFFSVGGFYRNIRVCDCCGLAHSRAAPPRLHLLQMLVRKTSSFKAAALESLLLGSSNYCFPLLRHCSVRVFLYPFKITSLLGARQVDYLEWNHVIGFKAMCAQGELLVASFSPGSSMVPKLGNVLKLKCLGPAFLILSPHPCCRCVTLLKNIYQVSNTLIIEFHEWLP